MVNIEKLNSGLIDACRHEDLDKVKHFIQRGACVDKIKKSLSFILAANKTTQIITYLVKEQQFNIHERRENLLQTAIRLENYKLIEFLVERKSNLLLNNILTEIMKVKDITMILFLIDNGLEEKEIDIQLELIKKKGYKLKIEEDWNKYKELKKLNIKMTDEFEFFEKEGLLVSKQSKRQKI